MNPRFDTTIERIAPSRAPGLRSDVAVPLAQSLVTGVLIGGPLGLVTWCIGADVIVIPSMILVVAAAAWVWRLPRADKTMWATERRLGVDLDGDGVVGEVERLIGLNPYRGQQARSETDRAAQESRLADFLRESYSNTTMAYLEGRKFDRGTEIQPWRDMLIRGGWARWNSEQNPRLGWSFCEDVTLDELLDALVEM